MCWNTRDTLGSLPMADGLRMVCTTLRPPVRLNAKPTGTEPLLAVPSLFSHKWGDDWEYKFVGGGGGEDEWLLWCGGHGGGDRSPNSKCTVLRRRLATYFRQYGTGRLWWSHTWPELVWLWIWSFHKLPYFAWGDGNLAELDVKLSNMVEFPKSR